MSVKKDKISIEDFYKKNSFIDMLLTSKKYKDLYWSKEAFISLLLSLITTALIFFMTDAPNFIDKIFNVLSIIIGGMFGLLGFTIGGLALIVGSIGIEIIQKINKLNKFKSLLSIVFMFYFVGAITGVAIVLLFLSYLILCLPFAFDLHIFLVITFIDGYLCYFTLIYSVMLLGSCIRLMILNYFYSDKFNKEN